jgi:hypothetical protein
MESFGAIEGFICQFSLTLFTKFGIEQVSEKYEVNNK